MAQVTLHVEVDTLQLKNLEDRINSLNDKKINLGGGADALNKTAKAAKAAAEGLGDLYEAELNEAKAQATLAQEQKKNDVKTGAIINRNATLINQEGQKIKLSQDGIRVTKTLTTNYENMGTAVKKVGQETSNAMVPTTRLIENIKKFSQWYIIGNIIGGLARSLRSAVAEMKNVDTALVTIQRTMGATKEEVQGLTASAYEVAAALGTTASNYLNAVAEFVKAGYQLQAEGLGELSIMLEKVGNTTSETATQFLLSVDKAYQFEGSLVSLTEVMDGVDLIGNRFATSVEKIAEGLGTVAPVAAQAHVGVNELTAALGTITAVTQRSGSEAARALRALFLNIMGDTKTEIEEGVTWTTGDIAGLRDVLNLYAADVVRAADATGSLINPMEAIAALSQSMKEGVLTEQKLMEMVSDIGGKLRTSQLLALIQNWDMYQEMLTTYAEAAGTAAEEYGIYLDSWEAKTQRLDATWTQFVSHIVESNEIKDLLDGIIKLVEALDTPLGQIVIKTALLSASLIGLLKTGQWLLKIPFIDVITTQIAGVVAGVIKLDTATKALTATMRLNPLFMGIFAVSTGIMALSAIIKKVNAEFDEQKKIVQELNDEYSTLFGEGSEYADLTGRASTLNEAEKLRLELLRAQKEELEAQIQKEKELEFFYFQRKSGAYFGMGSSYGGGGGVGISGTTAESIEYQRIASQIGTLNARYESGRGKEFLSLEDYRKSLSDVLKEQKTYYESLVEYRDLGYELSDTQNLFIKLYDETSQKLVDLAEAQKQATDELKKYEIAQLGAIDAGADRTTVDIIDDISDAYKQLASAQDEVSQYGTVTADTLSKISEKFPQLLDYLVRSKDGYILSKDALNKYIEAQKLSTTGANAVINAEALKKAGYDTTTMSILQQLNAMRALYQMQYYNRMLMEGHSDAYEIWQESWGSSVEASAVAQIDRAIRNVQNFDVAASMVKATGTKSTGSKASGGSKSTTDTQLQKLKDIVSLRKSELTLMQAQNAPIGEQIGKMREIQAALHEQAEYLRKIGGSQADINALSTEWLSINEDIAKQQQNLWKELENAVSNEIERARQARDARIDAIDAQIDKLDQERNKKAQTVSLEEKQNEILEKRIALQNALNERTVRYYNAATGQWEWGANASTVQSARDALAKAQEELVDMQADILYENQKKQLEAQKARINAQYDAFENAWKVANTSIEAPTRQIGMILADIAKNGTPEMKRQIENVASLLGSLGSFIAGAAGVQQQTAATSTERSQGGGSTIASRTATSSTIYRITSDAGITAAQNLVTGTTFTATDGSVWTKNSDGSISVSQNGKTLEGKMYDRGGILSGLGGIKATREDEMVLPPDITKAMLNPRRNGMADMRMAELRYLYGVNDMKLGGGAVDNRIGTQYNGNIYRFGNITLSEGQARVMTVAELAQMARGLRTYNAN